jgi:hypothetical protein
MPSPEPIAIPAIPSELSRFPGHDPSIRHLVSSAGLDDSGQLPGLFFLLLAQSRRLRLFLAQLPNFPRQDPPSVDAASNRPKLFV